MLNYTYDAVLCSGAEITHTQAHTHRRTHTHTYFWLFCYDQSAVLNGNVLFWKLCTYVCVSCVFCVYRRCIQYPIIFFKCQYSLYIPFNFKLKSQNRKVFHCLFWQVYYLFKFKHFWKIPFKMERQKSEKSKILITFAMHICIFLRPTSGTLLLFLSKMRPFPTTKVRIVICCTYI